MATIDRCYLFVALCADQFADFLMIKEDGHAVGEPDGQEKRMLNLVSDIWGCQIVVKTLWIVLYFNFLLCSTFVLPLDKLFVQLIRREWLNKRIELLLLIIPC